MSEHNTNITPAQGDQETPSTQSQIFSIQEQLTKQLVLTAILVNILLLCSMTALIMKLGWMALLAVIALF